MTSLRSRLFHETAVAALVLLPAAARGAAALPNLGVIASGTVTATATGATVTGGGTFGAGATTITTSGVGNTSALSLAIGTTAVGTQAAVINWGSFDIGAANRVTFTQPTNQAFSVLNRVQGAGNATLIAGALQGNSAATAGNRGTIFVINEAGVSFANSATVTNLTGFVASSLDVLDGDFLALAATPGSTLHFATSTALGTGTGTGSGILHIDLDGPTKATIAPDSVLLLVAPKLDLLGGALSSKHTEGTNPVYGDAGVILASDARVALNPDSIISIMIQKGTTLTGSVLNGSVDGKRVLVAAASTTDMMATLLGVSGNLTATTATATDHGIVIAVGHDAPIDSAHSISFTAPTDPLLPTDGAQFRAGLSVSGTLASIGRIDTVSTGAAAIGPVMAGGGASFAAGTSSAGGGLTLGGSISAGGDLTASGTSLVLGTAAVSGTIAATGNIALTATGILTGAITAAGPTAITANSGDAAPAKTVTLTAPASIGDATNPEYISIAGTTNHPAAAVVTIGIGADLHLGAVTASSLTSTGPALTTTGAITLGATKVTTDLQVSTTGNVAIDSASSGGAIAVAGAAVTLAGNVSAGTDYTITGSTVSVGGAGTTQTAVGNILVQSSGALAAAGTLTADSGGAGGDKLVLDAGGAITLVTGVTTGANLTAGPARQSDVLVRTGGDVTLGDISARQFSGATKVPLMGTVADYTATPSFTTAHAITLGAVTTTQSNSIAATGPVGDGDLTITGDTSSAGAVTLLSTSGTLTTGDVLAFAGGASLTGGAGIARTAGAHVIAASDDVLLASDGGVVVDTVRAGGTLTVDGATKPAAASMTATSLESTGTLAVTTTGLLDVSGGTVAIESKALAADLSGFTGAAIAVPASLSLTSTGGAVTAASLSATGDVGISANQLATVAGSVVAGGNYTVSGASVALGKVGSGTTQTAQGDLTITATSGAITAAGAIDLVANATSSSPAGAGNLTLTAATNIGDPAQPGSISVYGGPINGGTASRRAITLDVTASLTGSISLGTVRGAALTGPAAVPLQAGGPVALGDVDVLGDLNVKSAAGLSLTSGVATGNIALGGTAITLGAASATKALTTATAAKTLTLTASAGGAAAVTALGNFTISAPGAVVVQQSAGVAANVTHDDSLAITGSSVAVGNIGLAATPPALIGSGNVVLTASGPLTTDAVIAGVITARNAVTAMSASGSVTVGGATSGTAGATPHDVTVTAATNADVTGAVTSAGNYTVLAHGITLGSAVAGVVQSAVGNVYVRSGSNIFASGTLVADSGGIGGKRLVLDASSGALFNSGFGPVNLRAGPAVGVPTSDILLSVASGSDLTLGSVAASSFGTATPNAMPISVGDYTPAGTLLLSGAVTLGTVTTVDALTIGSTGATAGHRDVKVGVVSSGGAITVSSAHGAVTLAGATSGGVANDVTVTALGTATVSGAVTSTGAYKVQGGDVALGGAGIVQTAVGDVLVKAVTGDVGVTGALTADNAGGGGHVLVLDSNGAIGGGASLSAGTKSDILLAVDGDIVLGTVNARQFASTATALPLAAANYSATVADTLSTTGAISLGAVTTAQSNAILATGTTPLHRDVTLAADTSSGGSVAVGSSHGAVSIAGRVSADSSVNLHADGADPMDPTAGTLSVATVEAFNGDATLLGVTSVTVATGHSVAALNNVNLLSDGTIAVDAVRAGGIITVAGVAPATGAASLTENGLAAHGGISITTVGAIDVTSSGLMLSTPRPQIDADLGGFNTNPNNTDIASIALTSTAGSIKAAAIAATGSITLNAATTATVTGNVEAGASGGSGDYVVTGAQDVLGGAATTQKASGDVLIRSTGGDIKLAGTFIADDRGTGGRRLVLDTAGAIGQVPTATPGSPLPAAILFAGVAAPAHRSDVLIRQSDDTQPITLGAVTANQLASAATTATPPTSVGDYTVPVANTLTTAGAITLGAVDTTQSSTIVSTGAAGTGKIAIGVGGETSGGAIALNATGAITVAGSVVSGGAITIGGTTGVGSAAASFSGTTLQANGKISVTTDGAIALTGTGPAKTATERAAFDPTLKTFSGGNVADADIVLTSNDGTITAADLASTGNIALKAGAMVTVGGTVAAGDGMTFAGNGNYSALGSSITLGGGVPGQAALGNITLETPGAIALTALRAGGTITARGIPVGPTPTSAASLVGDSLQANGAITVATTGAITLQGLHAVGVATERRAIDASLDDFTGAATAGDASVSLTATGSSTPSVPGTISVNGGASTGNIVLTAGTASAPVAHGAILATGTFAAGDNATASGSGDFTASAYDIADASAAIINARHNIDVASRTDAALIGTGIAADGNVDALGGTAATIASGMASGTAGLGNVRATSTGGGLAKITSGSATQTVVASGGSATIGSATAGDDIVLLASTGSATATTLTVTGAATTEAAATDAGGGALTFGGNPVTGLGGSNVIIRAAGAATVTGAVSVTQANVAKTANYDILAGAVTLGTGGVPLAQGAAGRVDITTSSGDVVFAGLGGSLTSNVGGNRVANNVASAAVAGGGLTIAAAGSVAGTTTNLVATARALPAGYDVRANQPGVAVASTTGSVDLATITGGPVTVTAPVVVDVPLVTSWGDVVLAGSPSFADTATIMPVRIVVDGLNAGLVNPALRYAPANVTVAGGSGAEVTSLGVTNGGLVGALEVLSNSGAATLRATPNDPTKIVSILVESQTGVAGILNPAGGAASSTNPNTVAAQTIVLRGRQVGSSVLATGPLLATGSILATGPSVTIGTAAVAGTPLDGTGDILIAATNTASLAAGATESAVARRTIDVTGGAATLGDGTATGGTLAVSGTTVTVLRNAVAGDDVVLTSTGAITAPTAAIRTAGTADLQSGDDTAGLTIVSVGTAAGTGYGTGHNVETNVLTAATDAVTGGSLTRLAGSNIVATAAGNIDFGAATLTAIAGRDIHVEAGGTVDLATASAGRQFVGASGGTFTTTGSIAAGDDLVIGSGAAIDVSAATLSTTGGAASASDARRADGTLLAIPVAGGALTNLAGSNIALAAAGPIHLGTITTTAAPSSLRAFSGGAITTTQAIVVSGDIALVGTTVADTYALTAGDDIVAVARGGDASFSGPLATTGAAPSNAALVDLAGNGIALPGEGALGRVDGSSILVAATGTATVSSTVASAGRYSVYGRGGIVLGTAEAGTTQSAAGDILLEASIGAAPPPASVTLADGMMLTANSDGVEAARVGGFVADPLVIRVGNGNVAAGGATLRALRTPNAPLADQGTVQIVSALADDGQPVVINGVTSIAVKTLDSASADLRAQGDVTIGSASVDAGLILASNAGAVTLTTLTVGTAVPLMTAAQVNAIDVKLAGATGATLGTVTTGDNLVRDITVATIGGDASLTTASARDDIVVTSSGGRAIAGDLTFAGTASDAEAGVATVAATDANGVALPDPYGLTGTTITGLAGRNIVVAGATAASLDSVTTAASDSLGDVRVLTAAGPATLTTVDTGGAGLPARVIVATRNGVATGTTLNASGDIIVDATVGSAVLTSGNAGRDGIVVAPTVAIGTLTAGDDVVAVATGGTLTAGTLASTGTNSGDGVTTVFRADGTSIVDPVAGGIVGNLAGGNVVALATGDVTVTTATATAAPGATDPGLVRLASRTGTVTITGATATAGDLVLSGPEIDATALSAGRDATITTTGSATLPQLTAGRDITITAASARLGADPGLVAAQRNLVVTTSGALTIGTARAGEDLTATGGSVLATTLAAGDALTVTATNGDATVTTATSTGLPLLADFSGFATSGTALGTTRDIVVNATGAATVTTATAVHSIGIAGDSVAATTATANTGGTDGDLSLTGATAGAVLGTGSGRDVLVSTTSGDVTVGSATALRDVILTTQDGTATLTAGMSGRDTRVTGSDVTVVAASADAADVGGDLVLVATGAILPTAIFHSFDGNAVLGQGSGRDISITAANQATATTATASRDLIMTAPNVTLVTGMAGRDILLTGEFGPAFGTVDVTSAIANTAGGGGILKIRGGTTLKFGSGYDVDIAGDTLTLTTVVATHDVSTNSTFDTTVDTVSAGHGIDISGSNVAVTMATANMGGTDGDLAVAGRQGNAVLATGSGRDVRVTASAGGSAQAGTVAATRDLFVDAGALDEGSPGGTASLGTGTAGRDAVIVGPTVTIGSVTAAANVVAVADAGTLAATTLTSTGTIGGDGLATIARADGSPVLDPTVAGSPAIGNLAGGNVIALASGDLTVGTATATAAPGATALGLVRLASLGATMVTTGTASAGDIVAAGASVTGGTFSSGRDATVTATGGDVSLGTIGTGRDLVLTASNDVAVAGTATASGEATLNAGRDINLGATAADDALDIGGNATLVSGRDIIIARPVTVGLALSATAGGAGSFAGTTSGGATTIGTQGNLTLAAATVASGSLALTSAAGAITALDLTGNGITLAAANAVTVSGTTSSGGGLTATGGSLGFGVVSTAADATLHATGALDVSGTTTTGGGLTATSDAGSIAMGAVTTGGPAAITAGDATSGSIVLASLGTTGAATLLAGQSATVTGVAQTSGALTATATNGGLSFGAIDSGAAATLRARTLLTVAGSAQAAGALDALSSAGAIALGSAQAATVTLRGATGVTVFGGTTATGPVTITADAGPVTTGDIASGAATNVTATNGAIVVASVSRTTGLIVAAATDATVAGDVNASGDVGVTATGGSATIGSVSNAGKLTVTAASSATINGQINTSADTAITASSGAAKVVGNVVTANLTVTGGSSAAVQSAVTAHGDYKVTAPTIALGDLGGTQSTTGTMTLTSAALTIGPAAVLDGKQRIQLNVVGNTAGVVLGSTVTGDGATPAMLVGKYSLSKADQAKLTTPVLEISAGSQAVDFYDSAFPNVTSSSTTVPAVFGVRTTGNITVHDTLDFATTTGLARVLTLGGAAGGADLDPTTTTATANAIKVLVGTQGLDNATPRAGGQIYAPGSTVQLRASYIVLGEATPPAVPGFVDALLSDKGEPLLPTPQTSPSDFVRTSYVNNPNSTLYVASPPYTKQTPAPQALVTAGTLVLAPAQWALIQNTGPTTTPGGGILVGTLKFTKVAGATAADPEIAVFGSINGKTGIASAISIDSANLDGISPNNIRINGCVALSTGGCIQSGIAIPGINLTDPGQYLNITNAPDLALSVELITGATNEALWREDDDEPGQNRPQRESRP